jgi:hypothetical protein
MVFCSGIACGAQEPLTYREFASQQDGKLYRFAVTAALLAGSPAWAEADNDPPLPVRAAIKAAAAHLPKFVPDAEKWRMNEVRLVPVTDNKWVYAVEFHGRASAPPTPSEPVPVPTFTLIILMSGEAIEPTITRLESP